MQKSLQLLYILDTQCNLVSGRTEVCALVYLINKALFVPDGRLLIDVPGYDILTSCIVSRWDQDELCIVLRVQEI